VNEEEDEDEEKQHPPDERVSIRASDKRVQGDNEFSDSEDEGDGSRRATGDRRDESAGKKKLRTEVGGSPEKPTGAADDSEVKQEDKEMKSETKPAGAGDASAATAAPPPEPMST